MKIKTSAYDVAINIISVGLLLGITVYLLAIWSDLPNNIPAHYNVQGQVDRWGNKGELWIIPITTWFMYIFLTTIEHFPTVWNTGFKVTKENKEKIYRTTKNMLVTIKLLLILNFTYLARNSILGKSLSPWYLPAILTLVFGSIIFFMIKLHGISKVEQ